MRNVSRFRLRAHTGTLKVELAFWQDGASVCGRCSCNQTQDEAHERKEKSALAKKPHALRKDSLLAS
eukprot:1159171-Pelagomonas_calceolata.AAC.4